jgi:DNA-binding NtrC family response regulator
MTLDDNELIGGAQGAKAPVALVVEDESAVRQLLALLLTRAGYRVLQAENGGEALDVMGRAKTPTAIIVTDVWMPEMDGETFARQVRKEWPGTPLVFISGQEPDSILEASLKDSGIPFLAKPFSAEALEVAIEAAKEQRVEGRE